jgi:hypothetical protein
MVTTSDGRRRNTPIMFHVACMDFLELYISLSNPASEGSLSCKNPSALAHQWLGCDSTENLRNEASSEIDQAGFLRNRLQATVTTECPIAMMTTCYSTIILLAATCSRCVAASPLSTSCRLRCSPKTGSTTSKKYHPVVKLAE